MTDDDVIAMKQNIQQKLDEIDKIAKNIPDEECNWKEAREKALKIRESIKPYLDGFDSQAFFIVTFGMLKAGKSTLVNTLVGKSDVSPVGHGRETTKRSSIIFSADPEHPEGVYIYKLKVGAPPECGTDKSIAEWRAKKCEKLLLALGGVGNIEDEFSIDGPRKLSELDSLLTSKPDECEFPPVIRINQDENARFSEDSLLKDGVAILDTPGLDGVDVNAYTDCFWQVLPAQGDFFMLVQSSMSGLNDECSSQIAKIYGKTENRPGILIVYNEIAAQFWLKDGAQKDKLKKDREDVTNYLRGKLREVSRGADPSIISVNAGAASAAKFGDEQTFSKGYDDPTKLYEESKLSELRDLLLKTIKEDRARIKISRLKGLIGQCLAGYEKEIEDLRHSLNDAKNTEIASLRENCKKGQKSLGELTKFFKGGSIPANIRNISKSVVQAASDGWDATMIPKCGDPKSEGKWVEVKECNRVIGEWVENVNKAFLHKIQSIIIPGKAILQVTPWNEFAFPKEVVTHYKDVKNFLEGEDTEKDFGEDLIYSLLMKIDKAEVKSVLSFNGDYEFHIPTRRFWHKDSVKRKDFDKRIQNINDDIKAHYTQDSNALAKTKLMQHIEEKIADAVTELLNTLSTNVNKKVAEDTEKEKMWGQRNSNAVNGLSGIKDLVEEIHKEIK